MRIFDIKGGQVCHDWISEINQDLTFKALNLAMQPNKDSESPSWSILIFFKMFLGLGRRHKGLITWFACWGSRFNSWHYMGPLGTDRCVPKHQKLLDVAQSRKFYVMYLENFMYTFISLSLKWCDVQVNINQHTQFLRPWRKNLRLDNLCKDSSGLFWILSRSYDSMLHG